jgi:hypothetical protein
MRAVLLAAALLFCGSASSAGDPRVDEALRLAGRGEGDSAQAQLQSLYDELVASEVSTSAALHYNLGTLALQLDDIDDAVLHLLAAARRDPWDDDIAHNLELALARRADQVSGPGARPLGARLPAGGLRLLWGGALALLGVAVAVTLAGAGRSARAGRALLGPALVGTVIAGVLMGLRLRAEAVDVAVVVGDVEARNQPDRRATGFTVHAGLTGVVVAEQDGFARLRLENGLDVWIERSALRVVP